MIININPAKMNITANGNGVLATTGTPIVREYTPLYEGETTVTPSEEQQTLETQGKKLTDDVTVQAIPSDYVGSSIQRNTASDLTATGSTVTAPAGYYAENATKSVENATWHGSTQLNRTPSISVDNNGLVTATIPTLSSNITPIKTDGYALASHPYPINASGSNTLQLPTLGAATYTPSNVAQEIEAGKYLTGAQTISPVAPPFYDMSGTNAWFGAGAELVQTWTLDNKKLSQTDFASWTPSTTAKDILATRTAGTFVADMANYDYYLIWETGIPFVVDSSATKKALPILTASYQVQNLIRRPNTWAHIVASTFATNVCASAYTQNFMRYYGTTTGTATYSWGVSYGIYATVTAATFSNSTSDTPTVTVKSPKVSARCSTTYMSTANAALIDQDKTIISQKCYVYRVRQGTSFMRGIYSANTAWINEVNNA